MKHLFLWLMVGLIVVLSVGAVAAGQDTTPQQTITQLKAKIRQQTNRIGDLKDERDAQDKVLSDQADTIATQSDTIQRLRARDPLDAVLARGDDGLWSAAQAIWQAFPTLGLGVFCGYDKASSPAGDAGLTVTSFTFYRWTGC